MSIKLLSVSNKKEREEVLKKYAKMGFREISGKVDLRKNLFMVPSAFYIFNSYASFSEDVILRDIWQKGGGKNYGIFYNTAKAILNWSRYYGIDIENLRSQEENFEKFKEEYVKRKRLMDHYSTKLNEEKCIEMKKIEKGIISNPHSLPLHSYICLAENVDELIIITNRDERAWINRLGHLLSSHGFNVAEEEADGLQHAYGEDTLKINIRRFSFVHTYKNHLYIHPRNLVFFFFKSLLGLGLKREENERKIKIFVERMLRNIGNNMDKRVRENIIERFQEGWKKGKEEGIHSIFDLLSTLLPQFYYDRVKREMINYELEDLRRAFYISSKLRGEDGDMFLINAIEDAIKLRPLFVKRNSLYLSLNYVDFLISPSSIDMALLPIEMNENIVHFSNPALREWDDINILIFRNEDLSIIRDLFQKYGKGKVQIHIDGDNERRYKSKVKVNIEKYSYSQLDMYASCPYRYYMKYVLHLPSFPQPFFEFGSIVHEALEMLIRGEEKEDVIKKAREKILRSDVIREKDDMLDALDRIIESFIRKNASLPPHTTVALESFFSLPVKGGEIRGYIDRVIRDDEGIKIIDYKTSKNKKDSFDVMRDEQLSLYAYAFSKKYGENVTSMLLWYLLHDEIVEAKVNTHNIKSIIKMFEERIERIKEGVFYPLYGDHCSFCDMFMLCPLYNSYFYFL